MTDHAQIIRDGIYCQSREVQEAALAALDALEAALQDAVEVAEEAVADADRKTEALREIANTLDAIPPDLSCGCFRTAGPYLARCSKHDEVEIARAALSEDE